MNNLQVRVHRTVLCCQSPFLMELVHSTEDGGDTVIILPDVEVDAMISVLDVLYSGQSSATTDYDKFQLTRLLLRLGLDKVARSLTLQLVTASEVRDENLNNLVNLEHSKDFKGPAINLHRERAQQQIYIERGQSAQAWPRTLGTQAQRPRD